MVTEIRAAMTRSLKKKQKSAGHPVFDYDSDEETEGGTWEHQKRAQEMVSTFGELLACCVCVCAMRPNFSLGPTGRGQQEEGICSYV